MGGKKDGGRKRILSVTLDLRPTAEQRMAIDDAIELVRVFRNGMITASRLHLDATGRIPSGFDLMSMIRDIRNNRPELKRLYRDCLQHPCKEVAGSYGKCMSVAESRGSEGHGRPRYRKRGQSRSIVYPKGFKIVREGGRSLLQLGKIGRIGFKHRGIPKGRLAQCVILRRDYGTHHEYRACLQVDMGDGYRRGEEFPDTDTSGYVGVDIGVSNVAAFSDGSVYGNPRFSERRSKKLRGLRARLSKTVPNTREYDRIRSRIIHTEEGIVNGRRNLINRIAHDAVMLHGGVVMEDLSVKGLRDISLSKNMTHGYDDASLGGLRRRIADLAECAGREVVLVDPRGTSQTCSRCHGTVPKGLEVRVHRCPHCGLVMDRDVNAARNMLHRRVGRQPSPGA